MTNTLEKRARELLAAEYERDGMPGVAMSIRHAEFKAPLSIEIRRSIRALEAALRLSAGADWQPIETAPEGETILLHGWNYGKPEAGSHIMVGSKFRGRIVGRDADDGNIDIADPLTHITHWQPLPAASARP